MSRFSLCLLGLALILSTQTGAPDRIIPNDPYFKYQASFGNSGGTVEIPQVSFRPSLQQFEAKASVGLDVTRAWKLTTGSKKVIVALLDDGFFYQHEDIRENIWQNPGETGLDARGYPKESNGVDDDGNGYVDDVMGWDFAYDDPDPDCYVFDGMDRTRIQPYSHSISALGIIGAKGNNGIGVAGINWDISMMLLKIGAQGVPRGEKDLQRIDRASKAIRYAADNGARIINWSGFVDDTRPEKLAQLKEAIAYAGRKGVLLVVGAGNSMKNIDLDENCTYPVCFDSENMLVVAEIDFTGSLDKFSGRDRVSGSTYGQRRVHLAAIGRNFTTELRSNVGVYGLSGGTSSATPVVTGVAALVLSVRPQLKAAELKEILLNSVTRLPALEGKVRSGGIINAYQAVRLALSK